MRLSDECRNADCPDRFVDDIIVGSGTEGMTDEEVLAANEADLRRVLGLLVSLQLTGSADKATIAVNEVEFAGHVVGMGQRKPIPGKIAAVENWERPKTVSEMRAFLGFCNYYSGYVRMYEETAAPMTALLKGNRDETKKGSNKPIIWDDKASDAFEAMKRALLDKLKLWLINPDKGFVLRTDASDYAVGAVLEQVEDDGTHVPVAFWSRVLAPGQRRTWTPREKETYAIICALRKWAGHIGLQPVVVCTDHQSLQSWHKEHVDTPSGPASRRARWHETLAKFDLSVVYVPGKDNTMADCMSRWAYPASKGMADVSTHGDEEETKEAKRIIEMERLMGEEGVKCFVVMASDTDIADRADRGVMRNMAETMSIRPLAQTPANDKPQSKSKATSSTDANPSTSQSCLKEDWTSDYADSEARAQYYKVISSPDDDEEWPQGLSVEHEKMFLNGKLLLPESRAKDLLD